MNQSTYSDALVLAKRVLAQTRHLLEVAREQAAKIGKSEKEILELKLAPDMYSFARQIQIVSDNAKGLSARMSGIPAPSMPDTETTFAELIARIDATLEFVNSVTPMSEGDIDALEISFPWLPGKVIAGNDYVVLFGIPNMYFHLSMAYANLRSAGISIGKTDYLGALPFYDKA